MSTSDLIFKCDGCGLRASDIDGYPKHWAMLDVQNQNGDAKRDGRYDLCQTCKAPVLAALPDREKAP